MAKYNTLSTLTFVKLTVERAENMGVEMTDDDRALARAEAEKMYDELTDTVKDAIGADEELYYNVMLENMLYGKVYEETVRDYVVSEEDFENYYNTYKEELFNQYRQNVDNSEDINEDAVKDYSRANFEDYMKQTYFSKEYEKWESSAEIEKNDAVWNSITLIR